MTKSKTSTTLAAAPAPAPTPVPIASVFNDIDAAVRAAQARGDNHAHSVLADLHVAVGSLKHKAGEAVKRLKGDDAKLAEKLQALL
jgi:class 3 adenylate cyclase